MENVELQLRPHHVKSFLEHEAKPELYYLPDEAYVVWFRETRGDFHNDEFVLSLRKVLKSLHENPDLSFTYIADADSICNECDVRDNCFDINHELHAIVKELDKQALKLFPKMKLGSVYKIRDLK